MLSMDIMLEEERSLLKEFYVLTSNELLNLKLITETLNEEHPSIIFATSLLLHNLLAFLSS